MATDQVMPEGKWQFDDAVADAFDDMLARSIPAYNVMRELTGSLAERFLVDGFDVVDLGCSRGAAVEPLVSAWSDCVRRFILVDVSEPMLAAARGRYREQIESGKVEVLNFDLRLGYPVIPEAEPAAPTSSVTLCVLTLQFTPIEYRQRIIQDIYDSTIPGGALLLVEKVLGEGARLHRTFDEEYLNFKRRNKYTEEQIARKKASLEGVLVSQTAAENERMLRSAGFRYVDTYYRWLNFAGWVAVR